MKEQKEKRKKKVSHLCSKGSLSCLFSSLWLGNDNATHWDWWNVIASGVFGFCGEFLINKKKKEPDAYRMRKTKCELNSTNFAFHSYFKNFIKDHWNRRVCCEIACWKRRSAILYGFNSSLAQWKYNEQHSHN